MLINESWVGESPCRELYRAEQTRELDRLCINEYGILGTHLMERAGRAVFSKLVETWGDTDEVVVLCGIGNNGGDGYVIARLAKTSGYSVKLYQLGDTARLQGDALQMANAYRAAGGDITPFQPFQCNNAVIIDAIFGTGLERQVKGVWAEAINHINQLNRPVLAVDIPSGLHADSGCVLGAAVKADMTISFIGLKQGFYTADGPDYCGNIFLDSLGAPLELYRRITAAAHRIHWESQACLLKPRSRTAHKGHHGHLLVVGGAPGFSGAARITAEAAARCGAGLVTVATHPEHAAIMNLGRPELMVHAVSTPKTLQSLLEKADVVALGPGLGCSAWGAALFSAVLASELPLVLDADGLNLLAGQSLKRDNWILTPHPGEAARLLGCNSQRVQSDRFAAAKLIQQQHGGVVVLKGAGTIIQYAESDHPLLCSEGNPGMGSGGMGDLLTGIIAALIAQGLTLSEAACAGVTLHARSGDLAAASGERGMLATDLLPFLRQLVNPK